MLDIPLLLSIRWIESREVLGDAQIDRVVLPGGRDVPGRARPNHATTSSGTQGPSLGPGHPAEQDPGGDAAGLFPAPLRPVNVLADQAADKGAGYGRKQRFS
jgi:hypothetical protein